jgi:two-component system sensor histidine kinase BaeS
MRRRITVTIVAVVAGALLLSGLASLLLVARAERQKAESDVTRQAEELATDADQIERPAGLANLARIMKLSDLRLVTTANGRIVGQLPAGVTAADVRPAKLAAGETVHGHHRLLVYAAAPVRTRAGAVAVVVLTRRSTRVPGATGYFVVSAVIALVLAGVIGDWLGHRIAGPLQEAEHATRRIAAGDLDVAVPVAPGADQEVASLAGSINTMAPALARSRRLERQFLMSVSHDLRTPLTSIRGFAEAIADGTATDHARAAEIIAAESRRLERLVGDLLDLAKLDARRFSLDVRPVDLREVVTDTAEGFRPAADDYGLALVVDGQGPDSPVAADRDRLGQVVANLVENALKFAGTQITVRSYAGPNPAIVVEDDGPGIAGGDVATVFQRLAPDHRTPARQVGSGLGLAIVAELVTAMGGDVRAESPIGPGGGTRMIVRLRPWSGAVYAAPPADVTGV